MKTPRPTLEPLRFWAFRLLIPLVLLLFPLIVPGSFVSVGFIALQYALFALGLNIIVGWTGLLDLGAAGFVAVGAYSTAILMTRFGLTPLPVLPIILAVGLAAGVLLGIPTLRHRLDYFAILTLGFAEMVALGIRNWTPVTGGSFGYSGIPAATVPFLTAPLRAVPPTGFYYLALGVLLPIFGFVVWLRSTGLGRYFQVIKHSEKVGQVYGINILAVKIAAFGTSAAIMATGGYLWAIYQRSIIWTEFNVLLSCLLLSLLVVGGLGNPKGVVLGAVLVGSSLELIRRLLTTLGLPQNIRFLIFASALVAFVHLRPSGILADRPSWVPRLRRNHARDTGATSYVQGESPGGNILEVSDVVKSFAGLRALDGLSLTVEAGSCVALIGPNGSGKTTLLNTISGLLRPDDGAIWVCGKRIDRLPAFQVARAGVGRSFQDLSVCEELSAEDNVCLTARRFSPEQVDESLRRFGITDGEILCSSLPYGKKKSLDLARVFLDPARLELVMLDEPTAGLTQQEAMEIVLSLAALRFRHKFAIVVVSHDAMFLEALNVDRVVVMHQGRLFKEGPFSILRHDGEVRRLFWGDDWPT
jgi:ABC-type branched-subunit amino acid transport system permease subunit/ABC-type branched-subunit amino acid transport system ATPase component